MLTLVTFGLTSKTGCTPNFPGGTSGKEPVCHCRGHKRHGFDPWIGKIPCRRTQQPIPGFLPGESHAERSHRVTKNQTWLKRLSMHTRTLTCRTSRQVGRACFMESTRYGMWPTPSCPPWSSSWFINILKLRGSTLLSSPNSIKNEDFRASLIAQW